LSSVVSDSVSCNAAEVEPVPLNFYLRRSLRLRAEPVLASRLRAPIPGFPAGRGWDAATGFGSPKADHLVPFLAVTN
jgi:hypothetical protein